MITKQLKSQNQISVYLEMIVSNQQEFELIINKINRKKNGIYLTSSLNIVENVLSVVELDSNIFYKRILEPSCGQGIFILKLISDLYQRYPSESKISQFIENNIFFVDIDERMVLKTIENIKSIYAYLFEAEYTGVFNSIIWDFTDKLPLKKSLFDVPKKTPFLELYNTFDYVIGNPPYVTLYGRRDKKQNEDQRINYLNNYEQFPDHVKNGKINLVMLFIEHSIEFLKLNGKLSLIIDVSFFETAYEFTRKYLLNHTTIDELHVNISGFEAAASGQVILKVTKNKKNKENRVKIQNYQTNKFHFIQQANWINNIDEYKFRFNDCDISKVIIEKIVKKKDKTLLDLFPKKNLRTCAMLLDMDDKFIFSDPNGFDKSLIYPYYQGSKSLSKKFGLLNFNKYFYYNKPLQDQINDELRVRLESEGIKNKKRVGFGETVVYNNPKIYIRQSAKEIIATVDLNRSAANNSLYIFSLRNSYVDTVSLLYFLCGLLNSNLITYYAQQRSIIRYSQGKQPQIKISDLGTIYVPGNLELQDKISKLSREMYNIDSNKLDILSMINNSIYEYYNISHEEIKKIAEEIKDF